MIDVSQYMKLLPYSLTHDKVVVAMFEAAAIQLRETYDDAAAVYDLVQVDKLPERLLDLIAYEKHVDFYDSNASIEQKRQLVKKSVSFHRKKGTRFAVETILAIFFKKVDLYEWFEYGGDPFKFAIEVSSKEYSDEKRKQAINMISVVKNLRSKLEAFTWLVEIATYYLINDTYDYQVIFPYQPNGEKTFSLSNVGQVDITNDTYTYEVEYPVPEKMASLIDGESVSVENDTYNYIKDFAVAGDMETLSKNVDMQVSSISNKHENYSYVKVYPVCGEFYAESE